MIKLVNSSVQSLLKKIQINENTKTSFVLLFCTPITNPIKRESRRLRACAPLLVCMRDAVYNTAIPAMGNSSLTVVVATRIRSGLLVEIGGMEVYWVVRELVRLLKISNSGSSVREGVSRFRWTVLEGLKWNVLSCCAYASNTKYIAWVEGQKINKTRRAASGRLLNYLPDQGRMPESYGTSE